MSAFQGRAVVLIDHGYFSAILRDEFGSPKIDYLKFSETICQDYLRLRTYLYDCMPYQSDPPTLEQQQLYSSKQKFFAGISKLPSFDVRFGKIRPRPGGPIQKGVDVLLAVDLVRLSSKGQIQKAFLMAGDADYVPAVKVARDEGVSVKLYHSGAFQKMGDKLLPKYSNELWEVCDEREVITAELIDKCKLIV